MRLRGEQSWQSVRVPAGSDTVELIGPIVAVTEPTKDGRSP